MIHPSLQFSLIFSLLAVCACTSQVDDIQTPVVRSQTTSPGGIYFGKDSSQNSTTGTPVIALIDPTQNIRLYTQDGNYLLSGLYATTATNGFSAQARYFNLTDLTASPTTINMVGSFEANSQVLANYTRSDNTAGSYNLAYQGTIYEQPSSLAAVAGKWVLQDSYGAIVTSFNIGGDGGLTGITSSPQCNYTGQVSIIDARYNLYQLSLTETCSGNNFSSAFNGLATVLPPSSSLGTSQKQLALTASSSASARLFRLIPSS
jgi:hypothetical protein